MGKIPQGWEIKTLGELGIFIRGVSYKKEQLLNVKSPDSVYLLRANNIQENLKLDDLQIVPRELAENKIIQDNDILFAMSSGSKHIVGKNIILNDLIDYPFGAFCGVFRNTDKNLVPLFLSFYLQSDSYKKYTVTCAKGTNINNLKFSDLESLPIPLPPLETQQKIVAKLESEFAKIESAKSHLEKVKETILRLKNSLLKSAFSGKLTQPCRDEKGVPYRHCEDSSESEAIHNAESPIKDSIAESKAYKIVDCHELRCNSRKDKSVAQTPNFTQVPNLGGATLVAQNLQSDINSLGCHSEALAEESQNIKSHKDSILKDISAMPQYDKTFSICHSESPLCHSERSKESKSHFANAQYDKEDNLPQGWEMKILGDILSSDKYAIKRDPFGSMLKKDFFVDSGIRVFEQYNPINQDSNWKRYFVTQQKFKELESFKAGAGDLLISCSGTLGKILELPKGVEVGIINQALLKLRLDDKQILNSYFVYLFNSPYMQNIILENTIGSAIQNIASVKTLKQIQIPIPPLETQKQIVEILDSKFAALENLEKETNASLEKLQRLKSSLLNLAFKGELIC